MAEDRALPNLKARLSIDTSDAQRAEKAVAQARSGIQGMIADAKAGSAAAEQAAAAQRAEFAAFQAQTNTGGGGIAQAGDAAEKSTTKIRGLGAAATSMTGAFGGAAGEATRFASVLAYGGVAGAAAIGLSKLIEFGDGLNDTEKSIKDLQDLASKSSAQELVGSTITSFTFGNLNDQLEKLGESGAAGLGTLLNLRDAYAAAGQSTESFDKAIEATRLALQNQDTTTDRGKTTLEAWGVGADAAAKAAKRLADAAKELESSHRNQASAAADLLTSQTSITAAEERVRKARKALADEGTNQNIKSVSEERNLANAVESASERIIDAQDRIIDARQKVADAQQKLADAGVHERLAVQDAQDAVDAAQRKVNASTPEERGPAQHALDDAQQKLVDAKRALDTAKPDAERALDDAVRSLADAERNEEESHRNLADAQADLRDSHEKTRTSTKDHQAAVDDLNSALIAQAEATAHQKEILSELATGIKVGPVEALGFLKQALKDVSDELDPNSELAARISYLLASLTISGAQQVIKIATPSNNFRASARGGHLMAGEPSWVGDKFGLDRAELFVPDVAGTVLPLNPMQLAGMAGRGSSTDNSQYFEQHNHFHGDVDPVKAAREQRRELEWFAVQAAR